MNIKKVCKNVGHDGESYFCMLCGKAGYSTKEQAMGHLAKCKSRMSSLASQPASQPPSQPATTSLAELPTELPTKLPSDMSAIVHLLSVQGQQMAEIKQQYQKVYNEVPHLQAVQQMGFLGIPNNTWIWIVGIGVGLLLVYKLGQESKCHCDTGSPRRRLGSTLQDKVTDKAISYGISKLFK
jgi:hypothetical protein